jgi:voltage-gated potassium channel
VPTQKPVLTEERTLLLEQLEDWLETPMLVLSAAWMALFVVELVSGLSPFLEMAGVVIWVIFIVDFALKFTLAPHKLAYLKSNWLTATALFLPALRVFRAVRVLRVARLLQVGRATRGLRLLRLLSSVNRGMRALRAAMRRRRLGYAVSLTAIVALTGAAGMYAFEKEVAGGFESYGAALWWTAMLLTSIGSEYWPKTAEGRLLCLLLGIYGFAVFGYFVSVLASFFVGRDAENEQAEIAGERSIAELRAEIIAFRHEIVGLRGVHTVERELPARAPGGNLLHQQPSTPEMQQCIQNCLDCHRICVETAQHCLTLGGSHAEAKHIQTMLDCAQICQTSADFMLRGSAMHGRTCGVCAEACDACAADCDRFAGDDIMMKACADACRRCAESCKQMATPKAA